jgi:hypothetical protein
MHFDDDAVSAGRSGGMRQWEHQFVPAGGMARVDDHRQVAELLEHRTAVRSSVNRYAASNVRMPRSHRMTASFPSLRMYSALISNSSSVDDRPRFCMLVAPIAVRSAGVRQRVASSRVDRHRSSAASSAAMPSVARSAAQARVAPRVPARRRGQGGEPDGRALTLPSPTASRSKARSSRRMPVAGSVAVDHCAGQARQNLALLLGESLRSGSRAAPTRVDGSGECEAPHASCCATNANRVVCRSVRCPCRRISFTNVPLVERLSAISTQLRPTGRSSGRAGRSGVTGA